MTLRCRQCGRIGATTTELDDEGVQRESCKCGADEEEMEELDRIIDSDDFEMDDIEEREEEEKHGGDIDGV